MTATVSGCAVSSAATSPGAHPRQRGHLVEVGPVEDAGDGTHGPVRSRRRRRVERSRRPRRRPRRTAAGQRPRSRRGRRRRCTTATVANPHTTSAPVDARLGQRHGERAPVPAPPPGRRTPIRSARSPRGRISPPGPTGHAVAGRDARRCPASASARRTAVAMATAPGRVAVDAQRVDPQRQHAAVGRHHRAAGQAERLGGRLLGIVEHGAGGVAVDQAAVGPVGPVAEPLLGRRSCRRAAPSPWRGSPTAAPGRRPVPEASPHRVAQRLVDGAALGDLLVERAVRLHRLDGRCRRSRQTRSSVLQLRRTTTSRSAPRSISMGSRPNPARSG